jgi:hypothetical protein
MPHTGERQQATGRSRGDTPPVGHFAASPKSIAATTLKIHRAVLQSALARIAQIMTVMIL